MKVCNNCSTVNEDTAEKCGHCHMTKNFTWQGAAKEKPAPKKAAAIHCKNCGSHDPGEGAKCVHCHFPLPIPAGSDKHPDFNKQERKEEYTKLTPVKANLRVG